jgi:hypothetical protein
MVLGAHEAPDTTSWAGTISGMGPVIGTMAAIEAPDIFQTPGLLPPIPAPVPVPSPTATLLDAATGASGSSRTQARTRDQRVTIPSRLSPREMEMLIAALPEEEREALRREMDEDDVAFLLEHMDDVL